MSSTVSFATVTFSQSAVASASSTSSQPASFKIVGLILAVMSGVFIGSSFVIKKKGLLRAQRRNPNAVAGEGHSYLKDWVWWTGMSMMILGEIFNFVAYAFTEAILVTPLGALSVVICAILSHFFLKEKLSFFGWIGCFLCIVGSVVIALNSPEQQSVTTIRAFMKLFIAPGFLVWAGLLIIASLVTIFFVAPRWGTKSMLVYISVCSLIGGLSVSCTQGLGASILTSIRGENQVTYWFFWFLFVFVIFTLLTEINYLNKALELFNTAMVTPTYYVLFTFCTLVSSIILYQGLKASVVEIITIILGFLVICAGITLLQMSKVDPEALVQLDRRSTILLQASRDPTEDQEKSITGWEDPSMDALRGGFGTVGSIMRARSRKNSRSSGGGRHGHGPIGSVEPSTAGMVRYQLSDNPVPMYDSHHGSFGPPQGREGSTITTIEERREESPSRPRVGTLKFDPEDVVHQYPRPGIKDQEAVHTHQTHRESSPARYDNHPPSRSNTMGSSVTGFSDSDYQHETQQAKRFGTFRPEVLQMEGRSQSSPVRGEFDDRNPTRSPSLPSPISPTGLPPISSFLKAAFNSPEPDLQLRGRQQQHWQHHDGGYDEKHHHQSPQSASNHRGTKDYPHLKKKSQQQQEKEERAGLVDHSHAHSGDYGRGGGSSGGGEDFEDDDGDFEDVDEDLINEFAESSGFAHHSPTPTNTVSSVRKLPNA